MLVAVASGSRGAVLLVGCCSQNGCGNSGGREASREVSWEKGIKENERKIVEEERMNE